MTPRRLFAAIGILLIGSLAVAGEYNQVLKIGDAAPAWSKLPGVDGKQHSLADVKDAAAVVVVFTCNSCPVAVDYEDRIIAAAKKFGEGGKVAFVAINVNKVPEDSLAKMKARAEKKSFPYPYLLDETQKIANDYGATRTPEFFVLDKNRKIAYMGSFDDKSNPAEVKEQYVEPALEAVLAGTMPKVLETAGAGCLIRWARERR